MEICITIEDIFRKELLLEMHYNSTVKTTISTEQRQTLFFPKMYLSSHLDSYLNLKWVQVRFCKRRSSYYMFFVHYIPNCSEISWSRKTGRPTLLIPTQLLFTYVPEYMHSFNIPDTILWITVKLLRSLQNLLHFKGNINHIFLKACGREATQC